MRKVSLVVGVLLLAATFVAAWMLLAPPAPDQRAVQLDDKADGKSNSGSPLEPGRGGCSGDDGSPLNASADAETGDSPKVPEGREVIGRDPAVGAAPSVGDGSADGTPSLLPGVTPTPQPGEPDPPPLSPVPSPHRPPSFIQGHDRPPNQNLGNTRPAARALASPTGVKPLSDVSEKLMQDRRGLYAEYFQMYDENLPEFDLSNPAMVRIDRQVYFPDAEAFADLPISLDNFAAVWTGFMVVPEHGDYWLFWGADNGGRVELDGQTVLLQDGMVRYVEVSAVLTLAPGLHPLRIEFAQEHNSVADWAKCAANFMWLPQGQTKPVPVPPEMLMVPEWMWSDNAPIITSLSRYEGEIGDEITIQGQGFLHPHAEDVDGAHDDRVSVTFAGQTALILDNSGTRVKVRVPIGAKSGNLIIYRAEPNRLKQDEGGSWSAISWSRAVPSNSVDFTVTTQFGLMAEWHNLEGWANFSTEVLAQRDPEVRRLEKMLLLGKQVVTAGHPTLTVPFASESAGACFRFSLGVPQQPHAAECRYHLESNSDFRLSVNGQDVQAGPPGPGDDTRTAEFKLPCAEESTATIVVEWVSYSTADRFLGLFVGLGNGSQADTGAFELVPLQYYFPPSVPPKPPVITDVIPQLPEGEQPPTLPYDAESSRPSIAEGQEFIVEVVLTLESSDFWASVPEGETNWVELFVDGVPVPCTNREWFDRKHLNESQKFWCVMPPGVGEGKLTARLGTSISEPLLIDIANRGLVAYLYDVPDASGLAKLPDLGPLTCFKVRKDRSINFESAASFDLPFPAETFVIEWLGGLMIEEEGDYTFTCRSDDGMKLWLDDNVVLDADKLQAPAENSATVHLVPGTYRFRMQFFENNQHEVCVLEWAASRDGQSVIPREVIPARAFTLDTHPPFPAKTSTGLRTDGS